MDALDAAAYDDAVESYVTQFLDGYDAALPCPAEIAEDVAMDAPYHDWFARDYYDLTLYASILEHADADVADWRAATDAGSPARVVKRLALAAFRDDAADRAVQRANGGAADD